MVQMQRVPARLRVCQVCCSSPVIWNLQCLPMVAVSMVLADPEATDSLYLKSTSLTPLKACTRATSPNSSPCMGVTPCLLAAFLLRGRTSCSRLAGQRILINTKCLTNITNSSSNPPWSNDLRLRIRHHEAEEQLWVAQIRATQISHSIEPSLKVKL